MHLGFGPLCPSSRPIRSPPIRNFSTLSAQFLNCYKVFSEIRQYLQVLVVHLPHYVVDQPKYSSLSKVCTLMIVPYRICRESRANPLHRTLLHPLRSPLWGGETCPPPTPKSVLVALISMLLIDNFEDNYDTATQGCKNGLNFLIPNLLNIPNVLLQ